MITPCLGSSRSVLSDCLDQLTYQTLFGPWIPLWSKAPGHGTINHRCPRPAWRRPTDQITWCRDTAVAEAPRTGRCQKTLIASIRANEACASIKFKHQCSLCRRNSGLLRKNRSGAGKHLKHLIKV